MVTSRRPSRTVSLGPWVAALGVGVVALGLCLWRVMPGLGFWDTAEFQTVLPVMGTAHPTGYPTYVLIGWLASVVLAPLGEAAFRVNVLSAILVGIGAAVTVDLARRLSGSLLIAIVTGLGVATAPIVWAIGTHADPHALHFAFVAIILWLLVRWEQGRRRDPFHDSLRRDDPLDEPVDEPAPADASGSGSAEASAAGRRADRLLLAAAAVVGLSVGNHSLTLLLGPPILFFVVAVEPGILRRRRFVLANIAAFAIPTILVRFEMVLRGGWFRAPFVYADPGTWTGFWYVTLGAQFHGWVTDPFGDLPQRVADLLAIFAAQFGPLAAVVAVAAVVTIVRQPRYALLSGMTLVLTCAFNSVYPDGAIDRYYIGPVLIAWTWLAILGATVVDLFVDRDGGWDDRIAGMGLLLPAALRPVAVTVVAGLLLAPTLIALPARAGSPDIDRSGDRAAQVWTDDVLAALEPDAVVVSWWSYSTPLWYATIVDARRTDICIIDDRNRLDYDLGELDQVIDRYVATRPVYLIRNGSSELGALAGRYVIAPLGSPTAGNVLRVTASPDHGGPVAPPPGSSEPCR